MSAGDIPFNRRAVRPVQCLRDGWALIRDDYWLFLGITVVGTLIAGLVPLGLLLGPMNCGIYLCLLRREAGRRVTFDMLFQGFNHFAPSLIVSLFVIVPSLFAVVLYYVLTFVALFGILGAQPGRGQEPDGAAVAAFFAVMGALVLALTLFLTLLNALLVFAFELVVDRGLSGLDAVRVSVKAAVANFGGVLGLLVLYSLMSLAGVLACYVGAFFVLPLGYATTVIAYRQVFPSTGAFAEPEFAPEGDEPLEPDATGIRTAPTAARPGGPRVDPEGIREA